MNTTDINAKQMNLVRGQFATLLVEAFQRYAPPRRRLVGIVINATAPADFAAAVAEVLAPGHVASVPPLPASVEDERIGEEIGCCPFLW